MQIMKHHVIQAADDLMDGLEEIIEAAVEGKRRNRHILIGLFFCFWGVVILLSWQLKLRDGLITKFSRDIGLKADQL